MAGDNGPASFVRPRLRSFLLIVTNALMLILSFVSSWNQVSMYVNQILKKLTQWWRQEKVTSHVTSYSSHNECWAPGNKRYGYIPRTF